jgi:hypothetical protein
MRVPRIGAVEEGDVMAITPSKRHMSVRWQERSTDLVERYEMSLRGASGVVLRQQIDGGGYSAYMGCEGRQQWAEQLFGNVQDAQAWCERELVARTSK